MEDVRSTREPLIITKRGKPVAKLVPVDNPEKDDFIGRLKGVFQVVGDIESPVVPLEDWDALK
jgi:antitoxin (DNA-binding transcriptional repressor) of toxin-antitoxin stability system